MLFLVLRERCAALAPEVLGQAEQWLSLTAWPSRGFFREISEAAVARTPGTFGDNRLPQHPPEPISPKGEPVAVAEEHVLSVLRSAADHPEVFPAFDRRAGQETMAAAGGPGVHFWDHPEVFPAFDRRAEQETMTAAVARAFNVEQQLMVEAGTGTGKSLAYLIPAACHAVANGDRVVVSTATINLQEQLLKKDIPGVQRLMGCENRGTGNKEQERLKACQLKGRRNYLCLKRFDALRTAGVMSDEEALLAARIVIWLAQTETGDRAELRLSQGEEAVWRRLSADGADCTSSNSPYVVEGSCFLQKARRKGEASHIVVVNHALLLSDKASGGRVLPAYTRLVVDEAHHLEDEATRQFGFSSGERAVSELLERCESLPGQIQAGLRTLESALGPHAELAGVTAELSRRAGASRQPVRDCFGALAAFMQQHTIEGFEREQRLLFNRAMRVQPDWPEIEITWENLRLVLNQIIARLKQLEQSLTAPGAAEMLNYELIRRSEERRVGK